MLNYWLHPQAREDLREAAGFYGSNAGVELSHALFAEFERSVALLLEYPGLGAAWRHGKRRFLTMHFPFAILYAVVGDRLVVFAVAHQTRRPGYWRALQ